MVLSLHSHIIIDHISLCWHSSCSWPPGPFSEVVSIVVVSLCGLGLLLPVSALLLSLCCYCWRRHSRKKAVRETSVSRERVQCTIPAESYLFPSYGGNDEGGVEGACGNGVARHRERRLPLPPEPEIGIGGESYYEELDEVDVTSGVTLPRLPTFSSETSEAGGTELETVISAATDTQLVTS